MSGKQNTNRVLVRQSTQEVSQNPKQILKKYLVYPTSSGNYKGPGPESGHFLVQCQLPRSAACSFEGPGIPRLKKWFVKEPCPVGGFSRWFLCKVFSHGTF